MKLLKYILIAIYEAIFTKQDKAEKLSPVTENFEFVDRYGGHYPDPKTMCAGQCEGFGFYPHRLTDEDATPEENRRWWIAHRDVNSHYDEQIKVYEECDGVHFITCPDCEGSGKAK